VTLQPELNDMVETKNDTYVCCECGQTKKDSKSRWAFTGDAYTIKTKDAPKICWECKRTINLMNEINNEFVTIHRSLRIIEKKNKELNELKFKMLKSKIQTEKEQ